MVFASFEENSKTQCRDREGGELFLLSNTTGLGVFTATLSPPLPTPAGPYPDVVQRRGAQPMEVAGSGAGLLGQCYSPGHSLAALFPCCHGCARDGAWCIKAQKH